MSIELEELSYDELLALNGRIIARLKHLDAADVLNAMITRHPNRVIGAAIIDD